MFCAALIPTFRLVAFLLAAPLTVLGIYCVFPHPFYDPDCTFVILCCVLLLLQLERKGFPPLRAFLTGIVFVIPLFVKQNTGLAFLATAAMAVVILIARDAWHGQRVSGCVWLLGGMAAGLGAAMLLLHFTVGLKNYWHWTFQFAASRRLPQLSEMFAPYQNPLLLLWFAAFAAGAFLLRQQPARQPNAFFVVRLLDGGAVRVGALYTCSWKMIPQSEQSGCSPCGPSS